MTDFEKLGLLYLGRQVDPDTGTTSDEPYLFDSMDLTTHAVCVGMTGSGKTGLCLDMLEEAAIDGIPVIAIDPKGDVGNLLLSFPSLDAAAFQPWINTDDAARAGQTPEAFAAAEAEKWKTGLAAWGQGGTRIQRLRDSAEFVLYTPGSRAARPLSVISSLAAPPSSLADDPDALGDRVASTVGSLLSLLGIEADPLTSRDHILLSTIVSRAWAAGESLDLETIIHHIQTPGVDRIGVIDLEAFLPQRERFALAMRVNSLLASPGFAAWREGDPLDVGRLLHGPTGKPRVSIISIAHLNDAERMFVVSLLLGEVVAWMRAQSGTTSLRALIYMDEVFGFLPPVANPPSKGPLLTLFKQARAFGVGVCLATQNPVDLDYKALSNAGTWMIGRLQTERDRARLVDGLAGASAGTFDRAAAETTIAGLGKRRFYIHNVHAKAPVVIESRWCLSYLRGPLTRADMSRLTAPDQVESVGPPGPLGPSGPVDPVASARPVLPPEIPQCFATDSNAGDGVWLPYLYGAATVDFVDARRGVDVQRQVMMALPLTPEMAVADWDAAVPVKIEPADLAATAPVDAPFAALPRMAAQARSFAKWSKDFDRWLSRTQRIELMRHPATGTVSWPDEDERAFRIRLSDVMREARDEAVEKIRTRYASKLRTAEERVRRAEMKLGKEQQDVSRHRVQAGLSTASTIGSAVLGALFGRRGGLTAGTIGKASTAAKGWARGSKETEDVARAEQDLEAARQALAALEEDIAQAITSAEGTTVPQSLETVTVKPKRGGTSVALVALLWRLVPRS